MGKILRDIKVPEFNAVAHFGEVQLKALCTALLLGSITFGGGYAAQAIDITDQIGLTDVANYITGNQLNIKIL